MPTPNAQAERPALTVERRSVDDLLLDPLNVRAHSQRNVEAVRASLRRFGQRTPLIIDTSGVVVAGNARLAAARAEGWAEVEVVVFPGTPSEARAYAIADNRTAELAEWDDTLLAAALAQVNEDGLLGDVGFEPGEMQDLIAALNKGDADGPGEFPAYDDSIAVEHTCPRCGYEWSGSA
jgi:ParB-like chromosome segregation protein Spo0J